MQSQHLNAEWLRQKYEIEGLSTYDIAKIVNRNPKRIYDKLVDFGIQTRPRGLNLKHGGGDNFMAQPGVAPPFRGKRHSDDARIKIGSYHVGPRPEFSGANNWMFGRKGPLHPGWRGGSTPERQLFYSSQKWADALAIVRSRDKKTCQRCGGKPRGFRVIHIHHIKAWASNPDLRCEPTNLLTLCNRCHDWIHSNQNVNRDFIDRKPNARNSTQLVFPGL
jgi:5-methylcytosine-specific restriction protein A